MENAAPGSGCVARSLLADGSLQLHAPARLLSLLAGWIPRVPNSAAPLPGDAAILQVSSGTVEKFSPSSLPAVRFGSASGWIEEDHAVTLRAAGGCTGRIDLSRARAELRVPEPAPHPGAAADGLHDLATLASGLLLACIGRLLAHAAGVVDPHGGAWLLVGDSHAGKSTTCINLVAAGWEYLSDDHLVIHRDEPAERFVVEGWPRPFNVDVGWEAGAPQGRRAAVDPEARWPGRWRRTAPLAGVLFPAVAAESPSTLARVHPADALSRLVRAMPWLFYDARRAPALLRLLHGIAGRPAFSLRLGLDTYRDTERLLACLAPLSGTA